MLSNKKHLFNLPSTVHYLNCASFSPNLHAAIQAGMEGIQVKSNPHLIKSSEFLDDANESRALLGKVINSSAHHIALFPSVSYGMAIVAKNLALKKGLESGQEIILVKNEFPSDVFAWEEICSIKNVSITTIAPGELPNRGHDWNQAILNAISDKTCLVVLPHVHWMDGTLFDLPAIRKKTREVGAWMVVDGSQSIGALPFDVAQLEPDALIAVGYKCLYGPYGLGFGYFGQAFENGSPLEFSWLNRENSLDFENLMHYQRTYRSGAFRYNMGEQSNFILTRMLNAGLKQVLEWGVENIQDYCRHLTSRLVADLREIGFWIEEKDQRGNHLFGIRLPQGTRMPAVKEAFDKNNISISVRGDSIRFSTNVWNDEADMEIFKQSLKSVIP